MSISKEQQAVYKTRPVMRKSTADFALTKSGREIVSDKPHETLLASAQPVTMQEQVRTLTRLSRIRRTNIVDHLGIDEYYGEDLEEDFNNVEGITPHEMAGQASGWPDQLKHDVPDVSGSIDTQPPENAPQDTPKG